MKMLLAMLINLVGIGVSIELEEYSNPMQVGVLEPPVCAIGEIHMLVDRIYVFCRNNVGLYRIYERQYPFQLLTVFHADEIEQPVQSAYSEKLHCFYVLDYMNTMFTRFTRLTSQTSIWKIHLDDNDVTEIVSFSGGHSVFTVSSNGDLFVAYADTEFHETHIVVYAYNGTLKNSAVIGRYSNWLYLAKLVLDKHLFITGIEIDTMNESWLGVWMLDSLREGKAEGHIIWKDFPRPLNISETQTGSHRWKEAIIGRSAVSLNYAWSDISMFACVVSYKIIHYNNDLYVTNDFSFDLLEFFKSSNTSKWRSRIENVRRHNTWISCQLSAAIKTKQRNLVAIAASFYFDCPSAEIYKFE